MFELGDRVQLTDGLARSLARKARGRRMGWLQRKGTVIRHSEYNDQVTVRWDDRKTPDHWPEKALEHIIVN